MLSEFERHQHKQREWDKIAKLATDTRTEEECQQAADAALRARHRRIQKEADRVAEHELRRRIKNRKDRQRAKCRRRARGSIA